MDGGQVYRSSAEIAWEDGPPPIPDFATSSWIPESTGRSRASADTMPASGPYTAPPEPQPEWCVDTGDVLLSMTTFELWSAIERREVAAWMRVWREGLECWTPLGELPELQWAVANATRMAATTARAPSLDAIPAPEPTPLSESPPQAITPEPIAPVTREAAKETSTRAVSRLIRGSLPEAEPESAPVSETRPKQPGSRWVFAGSAVASLAIAAALLRAAIPTATHPHTVSAAALPATALPVERQAGAQPPPAPSALPETSPEAETALAEPPTPASPPAARREDRGQRRMSRGGRRAR